MATSTKRQRHTITSSFVATPDKLRRLVEVADASYKDAKLDYTFQGLATLKNAREIYTDNLNEILELDNTVANPVRSVELEFSPTKPQDSSSSIDPDNFFARVVLEDDDYKNISVMVFSDDAKWTSATCNALTEQAQRMTVSNPLRLHPTFRTFGLLFATLLAALSISLIGIAGISSKSIFVSRTDATELQSHAANADTTEKKIDLMFSAFRLYIDSRAKPTGDDLIVSIFKAATSDGAKLIFILLPTSILIGSLIYMRIRCYPRVVFDWGDYSEYFKVISSRRRFIWTGVIASTILGIIGNLFVWSVGK